MNSDNERSDIGLPIEIDDGKSRLACEAAASFSTSSAFSRTDLSQSNQVSLSLCPQNQLSFVSASLHLMIFFNRLHLFKNHNFRKIEK